MVHRTTADNVASTQTTHNDTQIQPRQSDNNHVGWTIKDIRRPKLVISFVLLTL